MTGAARAGVVVLALAGIAASAGILSAREARFPMEEPAERLLYLRSGRTADRLMLSFDAVAADVYWIRTIQHYGRDLKDRSRRNRFELLEPLLDLTTTLDPKFSIAYRFGAVFLSMDAPDGLGRPDLAIRLLEKGLAANPTDWWLAHDIGFVHYFHTSDYAAAATWFERARDIPGAATWLGPLAATTRLEGGNRAGARQMLRAMLESPEEYVRNSASRRLDQIDALDFMDSLQVPIETYHRTHGQYPNGWPDLIRERLIVGIPVDPQKVPLVYDAAGHRATLSPESPLYPLPKGLASR